MEKTHVVSEPSLLKFHCNDCLMIEANIILTNDRVAHSNHHFEILHPIPKLVISRS